MSKPRVMTRTEKVEEEEAPSSLSQSTVIEGYQVLNEQVEVIEKQYAEESDIPRPGYWGGYLLRPGSIEFGQGRPSRLHDRLKYIKGSDGDWVIERLSP